MPYVLGSEEEEERLNKVITPWNVYETLKYLCAGPVGLQQRIGFEFGGLFLHCELVPPYRSVFITSALSLSMD